MKITDGKRTVEITIQRWNGNGYDPDWSNDYFDTALSDYDEEHDAYCVRDVQYCIDFASDRDCPESAVYGDEDMTVIVDEIEDYSGEIVKAWIAEDMAGSRCIIAKSSTDRWYNLASQELGFFGEYAKSISDAEKVLPDIAKEIAECIWAEVDEATWEAASAHFADENGKSEEEYLDGYDAVEIIGE